MNRRTRTPRQPAALAVMTVIGIGIGLAGAGCGSSAPAAGTGTAGTAGTATGGTTSATSQDGKVRFAECMRAHGVSDFPDPDANGEFKYGVSVTPAVFGEATKACKALEPPGVFSTKRNPKQQKAGLRFAQCARENGVKDFPDPIDGEPLINTYRIPSANRPGGMAVLNAALQKCRALLDKAAAGQ